MIFRGSDVFVCLCQETEFFELVMKHHFMIYDLEINQNITFKAKRSQRKAILEHLPHTSYHHTQGIAGQLERFFLQKERIMVFMFILVFWYGLSHMIFNIEILGESLSHQKFIQEKLVEYHTIPPFFLIHKEPLLQRLSLDCVQQIHWITIHQEGSKLEIHYLPKEKNDEKQTDKRNLIAEKEGMIAGYDLKSGYKQVNLYQLVHPGEILVSYQMMDSLNQEQQSDVEGKVYAYTFLEISVDIKKDKTPRFIQYYHCLLKSRQQLHVVLSEDEHIVQEIPLIFEEKDDKIVMTNYYVLYEQIAVKE